MWYARQDSNLRPSESESDALSSCATGTYVRPAPVGVGLLFCFWWSNSSQRRIAFLFSLPSVPVPPTACGFPILYALRMSEFDALSN